MLSLQIARGHSLPLGTIGTPEGVNFVIQSRHATAVFLVLYALPGDDTPMTEIVLHPRRNRTGDHWHVLVNGLPASFRYGWRVDGPYGPGHCFDPNLVLLDPASTALCSGGVWGQAREASPRTTLRRSVYVRRPFNWQEDAPPLVPLEDSLIYEVHVRGFTAHPSSGVRHPGTFAGLTEKIPYLKELGVTAVELLPIHEFDEDDCPFFNPTTGEKLRNYWGYNSIAFAAPKAGFAATGPDSGQVIEFREMVKALHAAGIEVILDVVFNHTGEGDQRGPEKARKGVRHQWCCLTFVKHLVSDCHPKTYVTGMIKCTYVM